MQAALHIQGHGAGCCARLGRHASMPSFGPILTPARGCQLSCSASVQVQYLSTRGLRASQRRGRREAAVCKAAAKNFYEILGVSQSASDRDIKSTYRKLAMKLHPDVNKRPDAQQRFMEVKVAYEALSDSKQRAEYDRRLRMGGLGGYGARGAAGRSSNAGSYGAYGTGPNYTQEPVPGLDDLIRELEKEFTTWFNSREKGSKEKTLLEELEDLGGELLDFLEESLGIKDEPPPSRSSASAASQGSSRDTRSAAERFDDILRQYGEYAAPGAGAATSNSSTGGGSGDTGYRPDMSGGSSASTNSTTTPRAPTPGRVDDDDIEAQLQALKKKLKKV